MKPKQPKRKDPKPNEVSVKVEAVIPERLSPASCNIQIGDIFSFAENNGAFSFYITSSSQKETFIVNRIEDNRLELVNENAVILFTGHPLQCFLQEVLINKLFKDGKD